MQERLLPCRSMFVSDRSFFMRDPARSLYSTAAYYLSVMAVNAAVTIINAAILLLLMYGMIGEHAIPPKDVYRCHLTSSHVHDHRGRLGSFCSCDASQMHSHLRLLPADSCITSQIMPVAHEVFK